NGYRLSVLFGESTIVNGRARVVPKFRRGTLGVKDSIDLALEAFEARIYLLRELLVAELARPTRPRDRLDDAFRVKRDVREQRIQHGDDGPSTPHRGRPAASMDDSIVIAVCFRPN